MAKLTPAQAKHNAKVARAAADAAEKCPNAFTISRVKGNVNAKALMSVPKTSTVKVLS